MTAPVALMYHDVLAGEPSGFETPGADGYKVSVAAFERQLDVIAKRAPSEPSVELDREAMRLTFDDGGASAYAVVADRLESRGWRGFFFVTSSRIDSLGFLSRGEIRSLAERGHVIGSHSDSHPLEMARLHPEQIRGEWKKSCEILSDIIGGAINVASIPGGMYSTEVARAASAAGIAHLFTSEPRNTRWRVEGTVLYGRYAIKNTTTTAWVGAVAAGEWTPRWRQRLSWEGKKLAKRALGPWYGRLRDRLQ